MAAGAVLAAAVTVPVIAFAVVPLFVRSTVNEARPVSVEAQVATPVGTAAQTDSAPQPIVRLAGTLRKVDPVHFGTGQVSVLDTGAARILRFQNVDIAGAPNMYVYLSDRADGQPGNFTDLGPLKATNGSFNYELPAALDLAPVRSVVVWCRAFAVTVTFAPLAAA